MCLLLLVAKWVNYSVKKNKKCNSLILIFNWQTQHFLLCVWFMLLLNMSQILLINDLNNRNAFRRWNDYNAASQRKLCEIISGLWWEHPAVIPTFCLVSPVLLPWKRANTKVGIRKILLKSLTVTAFLLKFKWVVLGNAIMETESLVVVL